MRFKENKMCHWNCLNWKMFFMVLTGCRKKKNGGKEGKEECGKVYECRFCSLKFCKSQALGGHMNRHRQGLVHFFILNQVKYLRSHTTSSSVLNDLSMKGCHLSSQTQKDVKIG